MTSVLGNSKLYWEIIIKYLRHLLHHVREKKKKEVIILGQIGQHKCQYQCNELAKIGHKYAVFL